MDENKFDILDEWVSFHHIVDIIGKMNYKDLNEEEHAIGLLRSKIVDFISTVALDLFNDDEYSEFTSGYDIAKKKSPQIEYDDFLLTWCLDMPQISRSIKEKLDVFLTKLV